MFILVSMPLFLFALPSWALFGSGSSSNGEEKKIYSEQFDCDRQYMVDSQIRARGIENPAVLDALSTVPRHRFVEPYLASLAYADCPLPIGYEQTISQPYIVAYMTEAAEIFPEARVLEIGTGCGYQAAILGELAKEVYSVEIIPELAEKSRRILSTLGYGNVHVKTGDGYQGWAKYAPYDAILVAAAPDHIPQPLIDQLVVGGKMVIPIGRQFQEIVVLTKTLGSIVQKKTIPVRFVPLRRGKM